MNNPLLKTGIPHLDDMLKGGIKPDSTTAFWGKPGVELAPFAYQFISKRLNEGNKVVYLTILKSPETVLSEIKYYGWDLQEYYDSEKLIFIDGYSELLKRPSKEKFVVDNPRSIESIFQVIRDTLAIVEDGKTVIVDSLSGLLDNLENADIELAKYSNTITNLGATLIFLFTEWEYKENLINSVKALIQNLIEIKTLEDKVILRTFFTLARAGGKPIDEKDVPFKIIIPGGVEVYIPKVLVTGPYDSGKTSFIHSASTHAVSVDRFGTTIALDHGHVDYKGFSIDLFGTPGQERFDPILGLLGGQALGVIIMLNSTDPAQFPRAKTMLSKIHAEGIPAVFVANKVEQKNALPPEKIRSLMNLDKSTKLVTTHLADNAKIRVNVPCKLKQEDINHVFDILFKLIV